MTALDTALSEARENTQKSADFYNLFLNSELFLPLAELPKDSDPRTIAPILIENGGSQYLMLFDELERLTNWAKREVPFAQVPGYAILQMMDPSVLYVLNVGTELVHQFVPDEVSWLRGVVESGDSGHSA